MEWFGKLRLFPLFEFYLAVMFLLGIVLRFRQYREVLALVWSTPGRWPEVIKLLRGHLHIFLTWSTFLPLILSAGLFLIQVGIRWFLLPGAMLQMSMVLYVWPALVLLVPTMAAMVAYDIYCALNVATIPRQEIEQQLDEAERWLGSRVAAPLIYCLTLGLVNPRGIVNQRVAAALVETSHLMNNTLYAVAWQAGLRLLFGLALWTTYLLLPTFHAWIAPA
jgi:hypothetical protein